MGDPPKLVCGGMPQMDVVAVTRREQMPRGGLGKRHWLFSQVPGVPGSLFQQDSYGDAAEDLVGALVG